MNLVIVNMLSLLDKAAYNCFSQDCGVGSPVIRLQLRLRLRAISIIRLRLRADYDLQLY